MTPSELLTDGFGRINHLVHRTLNDIDSGDLDRRPDPDANPIGWLVWHTARGQDRQISELIGTDQEWGSNGWAERFGLPAGYTDSGYGHTSQQVGEVSGLSIEDLEAYHDAVHARTLGWLETMADADFDQIVDERWDPPVTAGVRAMSIMGDGLQHLGQAAYVRGLLERTR